MEADVETQLRKRGFRLQKNGAGGRLSGTTITVNPTMVVPPPQPSRGTEQGKGGLLRKFSILSFSDRKDVTQKQKWHQQITQTANGRMPVPTTADVFSLFPWLNLRKITSDFLQKRKTPDNEKDGILQELIVNHQDGKVVALAACSHLLSPQALFEVLREFERSTGTAEYLQAFVAAAYDNYQNISAEDEGWARALIESNGVVDCSGNSPDAAKALFNIWRSSPLPQHPRLGKIANTLTARVCKNLPGSLDLLELLVEFDRRADTTEYSQDFIAAAFSAGEEAWAVALIRSHSPNRSLGAVKSLFELLSPYYGPRNSQLRQRIFSLTVRVCQGLNAALVMCQHTLDWITAEPIAACLKQFARQDEGLSVAGRNILEEEIPEWTSWAMWRPNLERIKLWRKSAEEWPNPMWHFLGPDFGATGRDRILSCGLDRVIEEKRFNTWLGEHDLFLGSGLMFDDTKEGSWDFMQQLFPIMDDVCRYGGIHAATFRHLLLDQQAGLDMNTLDMWRLAQKTLFTDHAAFLGGLLRGGFGEEHNLTLIVAGIRAINRDSARLLREYLWSLLRIALPQVVLDVRKIFLTRLRYHQDWLPAARGLNFVRTVFSECAWLRDIPVDGINMQYTIDLRALQGLRALHENLVSRKADLVKDAEAYIASRVLGIMIKKNDNTQLLLQLHRIHRGSASREHQSAALALVAIEHIPVKQRTELVGDSTLLSPKEVQGLESCLSDAGDVAPARICQRAVRIAAKAVHDTHSKNTSLEAWQMLVQYVMATREFDITETLRDLSFTNCRFKKYRNFVGNMAKVFGAWIPEIKDIVQWVKKLDDYGMILEALRALPQSSNALHCIITGWEQPYSGLILGMLHSIRAERDAEKLEMMHSMALAFTLETANAEAVSQAINLLGVVQSFGFDLCKRLVMISVHESPQVAAVQLDIWIQNMTVADKTARKLLTCLGKVLRLGPVRKPAVAKDYYAKRVARLMAEARGLEDLRMKLKRTHRAGLKSVLAKLEIDDHTSALEAEISELPGNLQNHVEKIDENTVELYFPLDRVSDIKKLSLGVRSGESLVVRWHIDDQGKPEAFCAHVVDPQTDWQALKHRPLNITKTNSPPNRLLCEGRDTRLGYMVLRRFFQQLKKARGDLSLAKIYQTITDGIKQLGSHCVVCAQSLGCQLYRPVVCANSACQQTWFLSSLEVRLADVWLNEAAVELLLAAIHAAATSKTAQTQLDLLPNCPSRLNDSARLLQLLDRIPAIKSLANTKLDTIKTTYCLRAELLLSWACNSFRGFLTPAPNTLRIPNMPGVQQFVLADSAPELSAAFSKWDHMPNRQVLFHGTSFDRLYSILCRGLIVCSGTNLQVTGAAHGSGIYLAEQPSLSMSYARNTRAGTSQFERTHSDFAGMSVLLGVEYAGNYASRVQGMHVEPDASKVCVRYIFLCPPGFAAPMANLITPAMLSGFHVLRQGARSG